MIFVRYYTHAYIVITLHYHNDRTNTENLGDQIKWGGGGGVFPIIGWAWFYWIVCNRAKLLWHGKLHHYVCECKTPGLGKHNTHYIKLSWQG
jgi:hypothetical protein